MASQRVLLFGDQTVDARCALPKLIQRSNGSVLLKSFLNKVLKETQKQAETPNSFDRVRFTPFHSLYDLVENQGLESGDVVL